MIHSKQPGRELRQGIIGFALLPCIGCIKEKELDVELVQERNFTPESAAVNRSWEHELGLHITTVGMAGPEESTQQHTKLVLYFSLGEPRSLTQSSPPKWGNWGTESTLGWLPDGQLKSHRHGSGVPQPQAQSVCKILLSSYASENCLHGEGNMASHFTGHFKKMTCLSFTCSCPLDNFDMPCETHAFTEIWGGKPRNKEQ